MKIGLFIPCYVDLFYPDTAINTLKILEDLGLTVGYPLNQTCCGQPMANSGYASLTHGCDELFTENFSEFDYIVSPSGSCTLHIKNHLHSAAKPLEAIAIQNKIFELSEFLTDILKIESMDAYFPHRIGIINSCHGLRGLNLARPSEIKKDHYSKPEKLLNMVSGIDLVSSDRKDECCGFGGTFCVSEAAVSSAMGNDLIDDFIKKDVEYLVGGDMSCLMHLEGLLKRKGSNIKVLHISQVLNSKKDNYVY